MYPMIRVDALDYHALKISDSSADGHARLSVCTQYAAVTSVTLRRWTARRVTRARAGVGVATLSVANGFPE